MTNASLLHPLGPQEADHREPVVAKRAVPKERVRLDMDVVRDEQTVSDEVRQERVEVEGDRC